MEIRGIKLVANRFTGGYWTIYGKISEMKTIVIKTKIKST